MVLVVVQRGHCFRTSGATGAPGEQAFTKAAADRVAHHVRALGHEVRIINADVDRALYAGDLFVALHYDSSSNPAARGASVGWQTAEGRRFADAWKRAYVAAGWTGGFRDDNYTAALAGYYGVRRAVAAGNRRAFIAEAGFHSSPLDAALLAAPAGPDRVGRAVAAAVAEIVGGTTPPPEEDDMFDPNTHGQTLTDLEAKVDQIAAAVYAGSAPGQLARQIWAEKIDTLGTVSGSAADLMRKIRSGADVDEAEIVAGVTATLAADLAPSVATALLARLPAEITEIVTADEVEQRMREVLSDLYAAAAAAVAGDVG